MSLAVTPSPVTAGAIPWYKSKQYLLAMTIVAGGACAFFPKLKHALQVAQMSIIDFVELVGALVTLLGGGIIWIIRQVSKLQPITLTEHAADAHPSTVAVIQTQAAMAKAGIPTAVTLQASIEASNKPEIT